MKVINEDFLEFHEPNAISRSYDLYEAVADLCCNSEKLSPSTGLVIGATMPDVLKRIRDRHPDVWMLTPGIGQQGGDLRTCLEAGLRSDGYGIIVPLSRAIAEADDIAEAAEFNRNEINRIRAEITSGFCA